MNSFIFDIEQTFGVPNPPSSCHIVFGGSGIMPDQPQPHLIFNGIFSLQRCLKDLSIPLLENYLKVELTENCPSWTSLLSLGTTISSNLCKTMIWHYNSGGNQCL
jgi:hypothetical protein